MAILENEERLVIHEIRSWPKRTRKWMGDVDHGAYSVLVGVPGCNLRCAHCYVEDDILLGRRSSETLKLKLLKLPPHLQVLPQKVVDVCDYGLSLFPPEVETDRALELTSGEPTLNSPQTLVAMANILKKSGVILGINTNGIRLNKEYLDRLQPARDNIRFLVSLRDFYSHEAFVRFTGIDLRKFPSLSLKDDLALLPFQAAQKIVRAGFEQPDLGVTLDTIAPNPELVPETLEQLFLLVAQYGLDKKRLIWDEIKYRRTNGEELPTVSRMNLRGYDQEQTDKVLQAATNYLVNYRGVRRDQIC